MSINIFSNSSKSHDKSFKLQSHIIGSNPNNMGELTSVAQLNAGTTILLFFNLPDSFKAANVNNIAEEPELTYIEYLVPIFSAHFLSN